MEKEVKDIPISKTHHEWILIILWSFGIALTIFLCMWLRITWLKPYLSGMADTIVFLIPHVLVAIWGIAAGIFCQHNKSSYLTPLKHPIKTLLLVAFFFDIIFALWGSYTDPVEGKGYMNTVYTLLFLDPAILFIWIFIPFSTGYIPVFFIKSLKSIFYRE